MAAAFPTRKVYAARLIIPSLLKQPESQTGITLAPPIFTTKMIPARSTQNNVSTRFVLVLVETARFWLQFSRARPGKDRRRDPFPEASEKRNPSEWAGGNPHWDVEESWLLLRRCVAWRARHDVPTIFRRGYARSERRQLKRRLMNSFFFGSAQGSGEPIYYNNFAQCDPDHADLFEPGRSVGNERTSHEH